MCLAGDASTLRSAQPLQRLFRCSLNFSQFIEKFALDPTWVKNHACYDELRTYGAIAA
jgi:hypothetical protein